MPILNGSQSRTITGQQLANQLKSNPEFYNLLGGAAGYSTEPFLSCLNEVISRILDESMPWKWNREQIPPFLTVSLQQDYCTQITDIGWLENAWEVDINNSTSNANGAPKPIRPMETVRDMTQTAVQGVPFQICYIPNTQAFMGVWQPLTDYGCGYGVATLPKSPIQQFIDVNGNILYIDSTNLGLNIESPGYTGTTITPPGFYPYGTSGSTQPAAPPNATPGTLVQDGTVVWSVASPDGYAMRVSPLPALNGLCWFVCVQYQKMPDLLTSLGSPINQIPDFMHFLLRAGVRAALTRENNLAKGQLMYADWEQQLMTSLRGADRQSEDFVLYPTNSILGGNVCSGQALGNASQPFGPAFYGPGGGY
jgi:hypothetical protein